MEAKMHNFGESLALSHEHSGAPWWRHVYESAFPDLLAMTCIRNDGWAQRGGIDRVLTLASGKTLTVDEKVRAVDYPDILLEYWSSFEHKKRGWVAKDLSCDFIAYAFIPSRTCYLIPFQTLRRAWRQNGMEWVRSYKRVEARNSGYTTVSVPVPITEFIDKMSHAMCVTWPSP